MGAKRGRKQASARAGSAGGADLLVHGGTLVQTGKQEKADVLIRAGRIAQVGVDLTVPRSLPRLDARGLLVLPGLIDPQVHFREPGLEHKEDLRTGSLAAIAGGVTGFCEMPNTSPPTTGPAELADKVRRASGRCHADFAFFLGATAENADRLGEWENDPGCVGIKVFMGSSTGTLLVPDDRTLERVLRSGKRRVAVHSEHEPRLKERYAAIQPGTHVREHPNVRDVECALRSTQRLLDLVEKTGRRVHLLHVSTAEEIELLRQRQLGDLVTCEVTPNHLFLDAPACYERWGTWAQMNPPVRERRHQEALRQALADGTITCIGSDHAPHSAEEKAKDYPNSPSGIPGVQTILPLLLLGVQQGWLRLQDLVRVTSKAPASVWSLEGKGALEAGFDGDLVLVDPSEHGPLQAKWLQSRSPCSPYIDWSLAGWPLATVLRGKLAYSLASGAAEPAGQVLRLGA